MTDKDELYREKAGKKASCKKMRGMNEKQKARKKCEIEWGEETAGRVEQHFLFADRHHLHLVGQVGQALVSHVEEGGLTSRLHRLLVQLVRAGGQGAHRRRHVVSLLLLPTPEELVLAVRARLRLRLDEARGRHLCCCPSILAGRLGSLWSLSLLALSKLLIDLRRHGAVGSLHDEVGWRHNPDHLTVRPERGHQPRPSLVRWTPGGAGRKKVKHDCLLLIDPKIETQT